MISNQPSPLGLLKTLLPAAVATYDTFATVSPRELHADEEESVRRAVPARRREFATGRHCARQALAVLGVQEASIPAGADRDPRWPPGVVGSITHSAGYCAAAVARSDRVLAIGIDAEPAEPLPEDVLPIVSSATERSRLDDLYVKFPDVPWDRLLFAAKEAVYKAWFPRTRLWLDFDEVEVVFSPGDKTFSATVPGLPMPQGPWLTDVTGRWAHGSRLVLTAVAIVHPENRER